MLGIMIILSDCGDIWDIVENTDYASRVRIDFMYYSNSADECQLECSTQQITGCVSIVDGR